MLIFFILAALAYGSASFAFGAGGGPDTARRWGRRALLTAAVLHLGTIGGQCVDGNHPFRSVYLVSSLIVFLMVLGYLALFQKLFTDPIAAILALKEYKEGRCLSRCLPKLRAKADLLGQKNCATGEVCAPCFDPERAKEGKIPTGACDR